MRVLAAAVLLSSLLVPPARAATRTWSGVADANWSNPANWGGTAPVAGDDLVFPAAGANQNTNNDLPALTAFHSITLSGGSYTLAGNAITLGAGGINAAAGSNHTIALDITLGAAQTWNIAQAAINNIDLNGMALTLSSFAFIEGSISGTGSITANDDFFITGTSTTTAPLTLNGSSDTIFGTYPGPITLASGTSMGLKPGATTGPIIEVPPPANRLCVLTPFAATSAENTGSLTLTQQCELYTVVHSDTLFGHLDVSGTTDLGNTRLLLQTDVTQFPAGTTFTIIHNLGSSPITGTFFKLPEGARTISSAGPNTPQIFSISYRGGISGRDVVLTAEGPATVTQTTAVSSANPADAGQPVTFTATVTPHVPGTVDFFDITNQVDLGTASLDSNGNASVTTQLSTVGPHSIIVEYLRNPPYAPSSVTLEEVVNANVPALGAAALALLALALAAVGILRS